MKPIAKPAFIAAIIGPIQSVAGWALAGSLWPGYDPVKLTISDLAAPESPVRWVMSAFFILGGTLTILVGVYGRTFALAGRIALVVAGVCTYGLTIFPTPLVGYSIPHRVFAIGSFLLSAGWPLFAMRFRTDAPWLLRPIPSVVVTALQAALAVYFMIIWTDPTATSIGVWERVVTTSQAWYLAAIVLWIYTQQRNRIDARR